MSRIADITRTTTETKITATLNIDGSGNADIKTGIGFFDHMLHLWTKHGLFDLALKADGDLHIDGHHTVEDSGIVIGQAIAKALVDKVGIKRYGNAFVPMDEALVHVSLDLSGRPYLYYDANITTEQVGTFATELTEEFLRSLSFHAGITLHVRVIYGKNAHHMIEGIFKALARALSEAVDLNPRIEGVMSTKGSL